MSTTVKTYRDLYLDTLLFRNPERIPLSPGGGRESTLRTWRRQGLPEDKDPYTAVLEILGITPPPGGAVGIPVDFRMIPQFEEKVLKHEHGHYLVRDWMGAITEISDEFDYTYIRNAKDFVTRKWHKFPVETRADWEDMKTRYRLDAPGRFPDDFAAQAANTAAMRADHITTIHVNGPFWQLREWCGFENLCMLCIEDPDFVAEMCQFWSDFVSQCITRITAHVPIDRFGISEDMAYKAHSMISPAMTREFLQPAYRRWVKQIFDSGGSVIDMDSDGFIGELIPIWIEAGINVCDPIEVAAYNDINEFRRQFGHRIAYIGGVDKRAIAKGGEILTAELKRLEPVIKDGGFIPGCDHGVPPDISWPNFVEYSRQLAKLTGWL